MIRYKFSKKDGEEFASLLRSRVNQYFRENNLSTRANSPMIAKSVIGISTYLIIYLVVLLSGITNFWVLTLLWMFMGIVKAFIGVSVMHDALHGTFSTRPAVNRLLEFSAMIVGADPGLWKIQHNVLHHTYTNIEHADDDITSRYILRFTPHQPRRWFHVFQPFYAVFLYSISTVFWVTAKDFIKLFAYRKKGLIKQDREVRKNLIRIIIRKIGYFSAFIFIPMLVMPIPAWQVLLLFLFMHMVAGLMLSLIFQPAHVVDTSAFVEQESEYIEHNWTVHQLMTTSNFAMKSRLFSWFIGGLNYQIEHHLFPNICHVHYRKIAPIVRKTAAEYGIKYHTQGSFLRAVGNHFRLLFILGSRDNLRLEK